MTQLNKVLSISLQVKIKPISQSTYRFIVAPDFLCFGGKGLYSPLRHAKLVQGDLQLALNFVVMGLDFSELEGLLLDCLLEVDVDLVGAVQGHLKFSDLNL